MSQDDRTLASQTPLSQKGVSLQAGTITARLGLASALSAVERGSDYCKVLNNFQMLKEGIWTSRGIGWTKHRSTAFNSGARFLEFSFFVDNAGTKTPIWQVGSKVQSYNLGTTTETDIITGLSATAQPCMRRSYSPTTAASIIIYCNGDAEPRKITSVSASSALLFNSPGVWPGTFNGKSYSKPKFCEPFGQRFVYGGFPSASTAFDILISDDANPEKFTISAPAVETDAAAFTFPPELGQLTSIKSFKLSNDLTEEIIIGGCTDGVFIITGSKASEFSLKILTNEIGVFSNRCWIRLGNDLLYLSTQGVRNFLNLVTNNILGSDALTQKIEDVVTLIDKDNAKYAHAVHHPETREVQFWVPLTGDGDTPKHALILKYGRDENGSIMPRWSTKDGTLVTAAMEFKGTMYGGNSSGVLQVHYSGDKYDTTPIIFNLVTGLINLGNVQQKCSIRNLGIITEGGTQQFTIRSYVYQRLDGKQHQRAVAKPGDVQLVVSDPGGTILGDWDLGTDSFPGNFVRILDYQPLGNGTFWEVEFIATNDGDALDYSGIAYTLSGGSMER